MRLAGCVVAVVALVAPAAADPVARCQQGVAFAKKKDLTRAGLYLEGCDQLDEAGPQLRKDARDTLKQLRDSDLGILEIVSQPPGMVVETDALPGEKITAPARLFVKPGSYTVQGAQNGFTYKTTVTLASRARAAAILDTTARVEPKTGKDQTVDFSQEAASEPQQSGPPPNVKHKNMMPDKYRGIAHAGGGGDELADPLAVQRHATAVQPWSIGARLGGGMFDDARTSVRPGFAVAAIGQFALTRQLFLAGRLDWSRRGGSDDAIDSVDVAGVAVGVGMRVVPGIALLGQVRGDLRFASARAEDMPVNRAGAGLAIGAEIALPSTPLVMGVRLEQGLTELSDGARDRAALIEIGIDWP